MLIRFRMNANATVNAWGWAIDNLSIQGPITGIEKSLFESSFSIYPNPTNGSIVTVKFSTLDDIPVQLQFVSAQGAVHQNVVVQPIAKSVEKEFLVGDLPGGLYIIKELKEAKISERGATRMDDRVSEAAMEDRKKGVVCKSPKPGAA